MAKITPEEVRNVMGAVRQHGSKTAAALALGKPRSWVRRRLESALASTPPAKPRHRVKVWTTANAFSEPPPDRPSPLYSDESLPSPATSTTTRVIVIGDAHDDPHVPQDRFTWLGKFVADLAPDHVVQIGDVCDMESLSFHSANDTESGRYKPRFLADMESLRRAMDLLTEPLDKVNIKARRHITLGNHEHRIWRFEDSTPETSGMLQRDFTEILGARSWAWSKYGRFLEIAGVDFVHIPLSKMCKPLSKTALARQATRDCVYGHTHAESVTTIEKSNNQRIKLIDVGSAMPDGFIGGYARDTATAPWWGAWHLTIRNGRIEGHDAVPMFRLKEMYG